MAFADYPEQTPAIQLLQRSLASGRLSHAYLLLGSSLGDLEVMAGTLARVLNCQNPPRRGLTGLPLDCCEQCGTCRRIAAENHPDVQWLRPESKSRVITVDQVRDLLQTVSLKPAEAGYKIAILTSVERLNVQAANAFLKTLEEPPPKCVFLLLSTEPQQILETILSRCLRLNLGGAGELKLATPLQEWLGRFAEVAAGESKTLLGRYKLLSDLLSCLAATREDVEKTVTARSPLSKDHSDLDPKLKERWEDELTAAVEAEYRRRRAEVLLAVEWWLRDVWLQAIELGAVSPAFPELQPHSSAVARRINRAEALDNLDVLEKTQRLLGSNVQEALALEVGLLKLKL